MIYRAIIKNLFSLFFLTFSSSFVYAQESSIDFNSILSENELLEINSLVSQTWESQKRMVKNTKLDEFNNSKHRLCLNIPSYPADAVSRPRFSRKQLPHSWYLDFYSDIKGKKGRELQLKKLGIFEKYGFLKKEHFHESESRVVTRFSLTDKGWKNSGYETGFPCFTFGYLQYQGLDSMTLEAANEKLGFDVYRVTSDIGVNTKNSSYKWAQNQDILDNFKYVKENFNGYLFDTLLVKTEKGWDKYENIQPKSTRRYKYNKVTPRLVRTKSDKKQVLKSVENNLTKTNRQGSSPFSVEEIKELIRKRHHQNNKESGSCFRIPSSSGYIGVDRDLSQKRSKYSVAILPNKQEKKGRYAIVNTLPYLEQLVHIGVLDRHAEMLTISKKDKGTPIEAYVYEVNDSYKKLVGIEDSLRRRSCLPLGEIKVDFVELELPPHQPSPEYTVARYKIKISFPTPPKWMLQKQLLEGWPDLRNVLEKGKSCMGRVEIQNKKRKLYPSGISCWWRASIKYQ